MTVSMNRIFGILIMVASALNLVVILLVYLG